MFYLENTKQGKHALSAGFSMEFMRRIQHLFSIFFCLSFFFFTHALLIITSFLIVDCLSSDETPRILHISGSKSMFTLVGFTDDDTKVIFSFYLFFYFKPSKKSNHASLQYETNLGCSTCSYQMSSK